jgi:hypothetical protein
MSSVPANWAATNWAVRTCHSCRHFEQSASEIEAALPGLSSLGSAYAAVRYEDGICGMHDRYVASSSDCALHAGRTPGK